MKCGKPYCACVGSCFAAQSPLPDEAAGAQPVQHGAATQSRDSGRVMKPSELPEGFVALQRENGKLVYAACMNPKAQHYKWLMWLHPDGKWVSKRKLEDWEVMQVEDQEHYGIIQETEPVPAGACVSKKAESDTQADLTKAVENLRRAVRTAWLTGVEDWKHLYDPELLALLGCTHFQDLYEPKHKSPDEAAAPVPAQDPISSGHPGDAGFELWWSGHMPDAVQSVAVNAWNAAQPTVQAAGYQLVPVEPTEAMISAAEVIDWADSDVRGNCVNQWNAMLAAAPAPTWTPAMCAKLGKLVGELDSDEPVQAQERKPLSEERIFELCDSSGLGSYTSADGYLAIGDFNLRDEVIKFSRAIEAELKGQHPQFEQRPNEFEYALAVKYANVGGGCAPAVVLDWLADQHRAQCGEDRPIQEWVRQMKRKLP